VSKVLNVPGGFAVANGIVLVAWLLVVPPASDQQTAALKNWQRVGTYVTEDACEYERQIHKAGAHNMVTNPGESGRTDLGGSRISESSLCVAEDDPRLQ